MLRHAIVIGLLLALALPQAAQAQSATVLAPAGDWEIRRDDEYCRLSRIFGSGDAAIGFYFYSHGPGGGNRITLMGETLPRNSKRARDAVISWQSGQDGEPVVVINSTSNDTPTLTFRANSDATGLKGSIVFSGTTNAAPASAMPANPDRLYIHTAEMARPIALALGEGGEPPMAQFRQCQRELEQGWDLDVVPSASLTRAPQIVNGRDVVNALQLPRALILNSRSLYLQIRMVVHEDGEVSDCVLQEPDWDSRRTQAICRFFEDLAQFEPALGPDGQPVAAVYRASHLVLVFD